MATAYYIGMRFRKINDWCVGRGVYRAGWPNFHAATYSNPQRTVYGHLLLRDNVVDWRDVPAAEYNATDVRTRFTGAHDYAKRHGYQHGFPNFHEANYGQGVVYGTFLIVPGTCEWRDVPAYELGLGYGTPKSYPMDRWIKGAHDYAVARGYVAGLPNGHYARPGQNYVCGVFLFPPGKAEWADIRGRELGLPDYADPQQPSQEPKPEQPQQPQQPQQPIADLGVISTWLEPTQHPDPGEGVRVWFYFANFGNAPTGKFNIRMELDGGPSYGGKAVDIAAPSFAPGQQDTAFWTLGGFPTGNHYVYCYLDASNQVVERTKANNVGYHGFAVG